MTEDEKQEYLNRIQAVNKEFGLESNFTSEQYKEAITQTLVENNAMDCYIDSIDFESSKILEDMIDNIVYVLDMEHQNVTEILSLAAESYSA